MSNWSNPEDFWGGERAQREESEEERETFERMNYFTPNSHIADWKQLDTPQTYYNASIQFFFVIDREYNSQDLPKPAVGLKEESISGSVFKKRKCRKIRERGREKAKKC